MKDKRINSRTKGNRFENQICKLLNERFNTKEFSRSPGSGAYATTHSLPEHLKIYGDIITIRSFKFVIECKKGYGYIRLGNILSNTTEFQEFIIQAERDAKACGKDYMVIFKQDRLPTLAITNKEFPGERFMYLCTRGQSTEHIYLFEEILKHPDYCWLNSY